MHLVNTLEVTSSSPRWAHRARPTFPAEARAIAIGLERTTVIVIENREGTRSEPGEVLRMRHVGMVRLLAGDGHVLARRRLASTPRAGDALVSHLLDEVRAAVVAAPHLVVGMVQDASEGTWSDLATGLARLRDEGVIEGWIEAIDRGALRARLARTLCVIEPDALEREDLLDHWDSCLDAWDDAIDGVAAFLASQRHLAYHPGTIDGQLAFLRTHREHLRYASLAERGLALRATFGERDDRPRVPRQ